MRRAAILACVMVAVLALGLLAWRPGSRSDGDFQEPGAIVSVVASLLPVSTVEVSDVGDSDCWDDTGRLTVPVGASCLTRLPQDRTRMLLCVETGDPPRVQVRGARYGRQEVRDVRACADEPRRIDLYDEDSVLVVSCPSLAAPCVLRLV
ncbi:hypothetical protein SAMN02745244_01705 [Tessaracoccus bendigoensis DSM 12906]|uniref:Uncharacterized protein n=1 Tax=Tessaracoccus bendigoensis DSM 12906 TaxID=1123357 RepID=A0A1M6GG53_9ACTN|nr:hypothetical protein [Tessaracoccus bendigoensis]SHJ08946.1 hypothetical protein SAMN02745244_01705 [Tessaracoccus bendigoensis DSM 12906]